MSTVKAINLQHPTSGNANIILDTSGNIISNGNIGLGTTSPASKLHISVPNGYSSNGASRFTVNTNTKLTQHISANAYGISANNTYQYGMSFAPGTSGTQAAIAIAENGSDGTSLGFFTTNNYSGGPNLGMSIDPLGRVTKPFQPAFRAHNGSAASGANITFASNDTSFNGRNSGWNGSTRFTAPVAGVYLFTFAALINGGAYGRILFKINGSASTTYGDTLIGQGIPSYISVSMAMAFYFNVNDYIELYNEQAALYSGNYSSFSGYLVG